MAEEFQKRLRALGVVKGARSLKSPKAVKDQDSANAYTAHVDSLYQSADLDGEQPLETLLPGGQVIHNELGAYFMIDVVYPLNFRHGKRVLGDLIAHNNIPFSNFFGDERLRDLSPAHLLYLDTETTGLSGAGVFAFMIGLAFFEGDALVVRQLFARDQGEEPAMLLALADMVNSLDGLATFNGRSFDLPLLETRYFMNGLDDLIEDLRGRPHIDLLHPARRLWSKRLGSCSLSSLEKNLLSVRRTHEDVQGWLIPGIYMDFVRSRDARELLRVFYHNHIDMLSMATLTEHIFELVLQRTGNEHPLDLRSLAKWQSALGYPESAEETLKLALAKKEVQGGDYDINIELRHDLGMLLRKMNRRSEAADHWYQIVEQDDLGSRTSLALSAAIELAKYFEWHERDLNQARRWTTEASKLIDLDEAALRYQNEAIQHRLVRIERKLAAESDH